MELAEPLMLARMRSGVNWACAATSNGTPLVPLAVTAAVPRPPA
jgi:hypothetical protein